MATCRFETFGKSRWVRGRSAQEEQDLPLVLKSWRAVLQREPRNTRVLEKIARAHEAQGRWDESETAWTTYLHEQETAHGPCSSRRRSPAPASVD